MARLTTTTLVSALILLPQVFVFASPNHLQRSYVDGKAVSPDGHCGAANGSTCKDYGGCSTPGGKCGTGDKNCGKSCQTTSRTCSTKSSLGTATTSVSHLSTGAASSSSPVKSTTSGSVKPNSSTETKSSPTTTATSSTYTTSNTVKSNSSAKTTATAEQTTTSNTSITTTSHAGTATSSATAQPTTSVASTTTTSGTTTTATSAIITTTTTTPPPLPSSAAGGSAHSTTVSSCPPAAPSGTAIYQSTDDASEAAGFRYTIYQGPGSNSALQLVAYLSDGTTVFFDFSRADAVTGTFQDGTSFTLNVDGSFRYVHAGCDFEIDGFVGGKKKRTSRLGPRDNLGSAAVTVDVFDMCGRPFGGQSINIQCISNNFMSDHQELTDAGQGAYTGSCAVQYTDSPLCHVANDICNTDIGAQIRASDHTAASCQAIANLAGQAAAPGTADAVSSSVLAACTNVLNLAGADLCNSFDANQPTGGDNCQVPAIDVYMYAEEIDGIPGHTVTNSQLTVAPTGAPAVTATLSVGAPCLT